MEKKLLGGKIKNLSMVLGVKVRSRLVLENDQNIKFSTKVFDLDDEIGNWLAFLWSKLHELKTASPPARPTLRKIFLDHFCSSLQVVR